MCLAAGRGARAQQRVQRRLRPRPAGHRRGHGLLEPGQQPTQACRSRGGLTTKLHLACEAGQRPLSLIVTAGQAGDSPQFEAVLEAIRVPRPARGRPRCRPDRVLGDKGLQLPWLRQRELAPEFSSDLAPPDGRWRVRVLL
jgi:hypothetical protein